MSTPGETLFHGRLRASANQRLWLGWAFLLLGIAAIIFPEVSTLVGALFVGWLFLISGCFMLYASFSIHGTGPFFGALLFSLLSIAAGVFLLFHPLVGVLALTILIGVIFIFQGTLEIFFAFETRPHAGWVGMLISGLASVILAILIAAGWPAISLVALGILLGVNLITTGIAYIFVSRSLRAVV